MAGRIPGSGLRVLSNIVRSTGKTGKSEKTESASFAGYNVSIETPDSVLRGVLEQVSSKGFRNGENSNKPLSEYNVHISTSQGNEPTFTTNVGVSDVVLADIGISAKDLAILQESIRSSFAESIVMLPASITTVANGSSSISNLSSVLQMMKKAE